MSTYNSPVDVQPVTLVRSSNVNDLDAAVAEAFGFLPDETLLKQGKHLYAVDTGTANTHLVSLPVSPGSYVDGLSFTFKAKTSNTAACTVNVNSLGVVAISREDGTDLVTGDIVAGQMCTVRYNATTSKFQLQGTNAASSAVAAAASAVTAATQAGIAATQAGIATTQANNAAASAATAVSAPGTASTSTSSISLTAGTKTFSTQAGKGYAVGASVKFARTSDVSKWAVGSVVSYNSGTGDLVLLVDANDVSGTGTFTDWTLSVSGSRGPAGSAGISNVVSTASNYTLTSTPTVLSVTPTGYGVTVTLPDATAINPISLFAAIINNGPFPIRIVDSTGVLKGFVPGFERTDISLISSSAAGVWGLSNADRSGVSCQLTSTTITSVTATVALDSSRELIIGGTTPYGVIYNKSTNTFGTPVLIRNVSAGSSVAAVLQATDQVLFVSAPASTAFEAVIISCSGNSITVNTAATATLSAAHSSFFDGCGLYMVGTSAVVGYSTVTPTNETRAMTISGTTVTIGAATSHNTTAGALMFSSGNVNVVLSNTAGTFNATPYTISGSTQTVGTTYTDANGSAKFLAPLATGRWFVARESGVRGATVLTLSGTTVTGSYVSGGAYGALTDAIVIASNKVLLISAGVANILTDTAGVASFGTALTLPGTENNILYASNNIVAINNASTTGISLVDCSTASPTLSKKFDFTSVNFGLMPVTPSGAYPNSLLVRTPKLLFGNAYAIVLDPNETAATFNVSAQLANGVLTTLPSINPRTGTTLSRGLNDSQRWITGSGTITKMECVA